MTILTTIGDLAASKLDSGHLADSTLSLMTNDGDAGVAGPAKAAGYRRARRLERPLSFQALVNHPWQSRHDRLHGGADRRFEAVGTALQRHPIAPKAETPPSESGPCGRSKTKDATLSAVHMTRTPQRTVAPKTPCDTAVDRGVD